MGYDTDRYIALCFWVIVGGLIGARAFYVIQKMDEFSDISGVGLVLKMLDMTKGGMVVYGSFIGALITALAYMWYQKMSWRSAGDVLAPGMMLGLMFGRIGCLMNGCCYGGVCPDHFPCIEFPPSSPPYVRQLIEGQLIGVQGPFDSQQYLVAVDSVDSGSQAAKLGIPAGDQISIYPPEDERLRAAKAAENNGQNIVADTTIDSERLGRLVLPARDLPDASLPVHPVQIYSSINALALFLVLWFYFPFRRSDGQVFAMMMILYPIGRFLLEVIRDDEIGVLGTQLTISQWLSVVAFLIGWGLWFYVSSRPNA
jgi:phosphatidylglycerol:prolipoprotein diacylglycerol transferase